jgi:hypothetical protein
MRILCNQKYIQTVGHNISRLPNISEKSHKENKMGYKELNRMELVKKFPGASNKFNSL